MNKRIFDSRKKASVDRLEERDFGRHAVDRFSATALLEELIVQEVLIVPTKKEN